MGLLAENFKIVPVMSAGNLDAGATLDTDSINMKNYHRATFIIGLQTLGGADPVLTVNSGATDGAITSALTFRYAFGSAAAAAANCDVLAAWTQAATLTIAHATYDNYMLIVEIDAVDMDMANAEEWLTLRFTCGAATGLVQIHAILDPRYTQNVSESALA